MEISSLSYVLMNYVFAWKSAFLQNSCQLFYGLGWLTLCQCYHKMPLVGERPGAALWALRHFLSLITSSLLVGMQLPAKYQQGALFLPPSGVYVRSFVYLFYTLIKLSHKSSERSSLVTGPRLNSSPPEAKNPSVFQRLSKNLSSSSVVPFPSCLQSFPASGSFPMSQFLASGGQRIGASVSASVLPMNIQDWFPLGWTG